LAKDILPPAPPGEQKPVLKEKKKDFLGGLFGKKTQEKEEGTQPAQATTLSDPKLGATAPAEPAHEVPDNINLEDIRKQLGLDSFSGEEIPEPPQMAAGQKKSASENFDLPDIEAAIASSKVEQPIIFEENNVEEPTRILPMEIKSGEKKSDKKQSAKAKPKKDVDEWTQYLEEEKEAPEIESEFSKDLKLEKEAKESSDKAEKKEFIHEVSPEDIKQAAKELKRKKFEEKKGIKYEPEVFITPKTEEKSEFLVDVAPGDELANIKKRLLQRVVKEEPSASSSQPLVQEEEKETAKEKETTKLTDEELELPDIADERRIGGKLSILENESLEEPEDIPEDEPAESPVENKVSFETPSFIETKQASQRLAAPEDKSLLKPDVKKEEAVDTSELIKEMEKNLVEKIRIEEKARVEKEFEHERAIFEKEKQSLEQEKIAVAGKASKYEFKEKQLKRDKADLEAEKAKLKRDKEEADDLLKKLPVMRKDYEKLNEKMNEVYETLKKYSKKEVELREIEKNIELNKQILAQAQQRLEETEQKIKEKGFSQYLETELKEESLVSHKLEEVQDITKASNLEIYNLIDECKTLIRDKNLNEAKKRYMRIREAYNTVNVQGTEKDLLYTAVRELYDDIKLAEMESNDFNFPKY
jgi:hypothetical protein